MTKQIRFILLFGVTVGAIAAAFFGWRYQQEQHDICKHLPRPELAKRYPPLAELLARQRLESSQLLAKQRAQDFMINLEMNSEQVDLEEALKSSTQQIEEIAAQRQRHSQEFNQLCEELVKH